MRKFGPMAANHPAGGRFCAACGAPFVAGDYTTLVPLGPGADDEARERCKVGRPYNAAVVHVHWDCADHRGEDNRNEP